jgi:hypothetical protein
MGSLAKEQGRHPRRSYSTWQEGLLDHAIIMTEALRWHPNRHVTTVTAAREANANGVYLCDASGGAFTLTLAEGERAHITVVKTDSSGNAVTVSGAGTINGAASKSLSSQWDTVTLVCDGTDWYEI